MSLERLDEFRLERRTTPRGSEGSIARRTAGAAGDLGELHRVQPAELIAVELAIGSKGDVLDIEIQAHADGVGRDQVVDVARLVHFDLGVAGARRQCPEHDRRAAALAPDQFGDGIDLVGGEGDDGGPPRQAGDLALAGEGQVRKARPRDDVGAGNELLDKAAHGGGPEQHGFVAAPAIEQPVGEDVTAIEVGGNLDLVDGEERDVDVERHGFDRRDPVARAGRLDLLFAGHQRDLRLADPGDKLAVDLARQEAQGQSDEARGMGDHALDRERRLARIGRTEDCGDPAPALGRGQWRQGGGHADLDRRRAVGRDGGRVVARCRPKGVIFRYRLRTGERVERLWNESGPNR